MARWTVNHLEHDGTVYQTVYPEALTFRRNKRAAHEIEYQVSLNALDTRGRKAVYHDFVGPYRTDFELYYGNTRIMAGMHTSHGGNTDEQHAKLAGKSWLHYFDRAFFPFNPSDPNAHLIQVGGQDPPQGLAYQEADVDYATVLTRIFDVIFAQDSRLDITYNLSPTGNLTNYRIDLGDTTYLSAIVEGLASENTGFDYDVLNDKEFVMWAPHRYGETGGPSIIWDFNQFEPPDRIEFNNTGPQGTHVLGLGAGLAQRKGWALGYEHGHEVFRRLDNVADFGNESRPTNLYKRTQAALSLGLNPVHEVTVSVDPSRIPNFWTLFHPSLAVWVDWDFGFHRLNSAHEIVTMDCRASNEGAAMVDIGLNQIYDTGNEPGVVES